VKVGGKQSLALPSSFRRIQKKAKFTDSKLYINFTIITIEKKLKQASQ
jgi:hypothetical protein